MYQISALPHTTWSERGGKLAESARINRRLAAAGSLRRAALQQSNSQLLRKKEVHYLSSSPFRKISFGRKASKKTRQGERSRDHLGNQGNPPRAEMAMKLFFFFRSATYCEAMLKSRHKYEVITRVS